MRKKVKSQKSKMEKEDADPLNHDKRFFPSAI
jgi:hypothetical protein